MKSIRVSLKKDPYDIVVGERILSQLGSAIKNLNIGKNAVVVTNPVINKHHGRTLISSLKKNGFSVKILEVPAGERSKSAKMVFKLIEDIARYDRLKKVFIIAFGGGVIGDLAGYVAAAYKRGIPYIQVPTTLLAQVDSAIGGKVAIDLPFGKNLVGAFYQPKLVWSDTALLSTLSKRQIRNGLAEIIKYGVIADQKLFQYIVKQYKQLLTLDPVAVVHVVQRSSCIKRDVVVADEKETKGIRSILNFGHTVGHAIEAAGKYNQYHHGEAIALGMRVAADISLQKKMCKAADVAALHEVLSSVALPQRIGDVTMPAILRFMQHDKKFLDGKNRFVLMTRIGKVKLVENVSLQMIKKAIRTCR